MKAIDGVCTLSDIFQIMHHGLEIVPSTHRVPSMADPFPIESLSQLYGDSISFEQFKEIDGLETPVLQLMVRDISW